MVDPPPVSVYPNENDVSLLITCYFNQLENLDAKINAFENKNKIVGINSLTRR
jgi:hypothetical protein